MVDDSRHSRSDGGPWPGATPPPGAKPPPGDWQSQLDSPWGQRPAASPFGGQGPGPHSPGPYGAGPYSPGPYSPYQGGEPPFGQVRPPAFHQSPYGVPVYARQSQATAALVLSLVGFFVCGIPSVIGALMGRAELNAIDRGESDPANRGTAMAAFVIGLVVTALIILPIVAYVVMLAVFGAAVIAL